MSNSNQFRGGVKSIQRGVIAIASGANTNTATISAVVTAKTELRYLGFTGTTADPSLNTRLALTNTTTITATAATVSGTSQTGSSVSWELTEFF